MLYGRVFRMTDNNPRHIQFAEPRCRTHAETRPDQHALITSRDPTGFRTGATAPNVNLPWWPVMERRMDSSRLLNVGGF